MRYDLLVGETYTVFRQDKTLLPDRIVKTTVLLLWPLTREDIILAVPKRLRPYSKSAECRVQSGRLTAPPPFCTVHSEVCTPKSIQTHGSLANWHPHLHLLVTDGGFRRDGTFVHLPLHDIATLTEAFRRAVLKMFVKRELMDIETAQGMLAWQHSGFHAHDAVWAAAEDKEFTVRLARYCARNPIALGRMEYDEQQSAVTYHSEPYRLSITHKYHD